MFICRMPRTYTRKTDRGGWSNNSMCCAVEAVQQGQPLKVCARQYGVPVNTLRRHANNMVRKPGTSLLGRTSILGEVAENELVEYILALEDKGLD